MISILRLVTNGFNRFSLTSVHLERLHQGIKNDTRRNGSNDTKLPTFRAGSCVSVIPENMSERGLKEPSSLSLWPESNNRRFSDRAATKNPMTHSKKIRAQCQNSRRLHARSAQKHGRHQTDWPPGPWQHKPSGRAAASSFPP